MGYVARVRLTMGAVPPSPRSAGEKLPRLGQNFGVNLDALPGALDQPKIALDVVPSTLGRDVQEHAPAVHLEHVAPLVNGQEAEQNSPVVLLCG